jgi:transposase
MLTMEDDVEIHALKRRGWSIAAIARHTGRDPKTIRRYLAGDLPRRGKRPSTLEPYRVYVKARFNDDPHLLATTLHDELVGLGFERSYPTLVRELRALELRPRCECCRSGSAATAEIAHGPGAELQFDWLELGETPWGRPAHVLVGVLPHSSRLRGVFAEGETFAHLAGSLDGLLRRFGGTAKSWRTDRMSTVVVPGTDRIRAEAAALAKHYGAQIAVCPPNRPQRKGPVERGIGYLTQSWWRAAPVATSAQAQADLDRWCASVADRRRRAGGATVGSLADREPLRSLPASAFPAELRVERVVSRTALVAFEGNRYSVGPELAGQNVIVKARLGELHVEVLAPSGAAVARHRRAPSGADQTVRSSEHAIALERVVLEEFTTRKTCPRKPHRPPGEEALAEAARLRGHDGGGGATVVDLATYAELAEAADGR